jgi:hypothetical protein
MHVRMVNVSVAFGLVTEAGSLERARIGATLGNGPAEATAVGRERDLDGRLARLSKGGIDVDLFARGLPTTRDVDGSRRETMKVLKIRIARGGNDFSDTDGTLAMALESRTNSDAPTPKELARPSHQRGSLGDPKSWEAKR